MWQDFIENEKPVRLEKPLTKIQNLILIRIFRSDNVLSSVRKFVIDNLGPEFTETPSFNLNQSYHDSSPFKPLIFILSPGVDPLADFYSFAREKSMLKQIYSSSLGQRQQEVALKMIENGMKNGYWVLLQNCHVSASFLDELERVYTEVS